MRFRHLVSRDSAPPALHPPFECAPVPPGRLIGAAKCGVAECCPAPARVRRCCPPTADGEPVLFYLPVTRSWLRQLVLGLVFICHSPLRGAVELLDDVFDYRISLGSVFNIVKGEVGPARDINARQYERFFEPCSFDLKGQDVR